MIGWHRQLDGHGFEQALGNGEGRESLACCGPWGCKELDTTKQLNNCHLTKSASFFKICFPELIVFVICTTLLAFKILWLGLYFNSVSDLLIKL